MRSINYKGVIAGAVVALLSSTAPAAFAVDSSLGRYEAYAQPLYDSYGNKVGIKVRFYSGTDDSANLLIQGCEQTN